MRRARATKEGLLVLSEKKNKGRPIAVWKGDEVLLACDGEGEDLKFTANKPGAPLHRPWCAYDGPQLAGNNWTPERLRQKYVPRVIISDEICTVPRPILDTFLGWLDQRGVQLICCCDQGQPPSIAGEMPRDWLSQHVDYFEEIGVDHRAKAEALRDLKKVIRLQPDRVQCQEMRKAALGGPVSSSHWGYSISVKAYLSIYAFTYVFQQADESTTRPCSHLSERFCPHCAVL